MKRGRVLGLLALTGAAALACNAILGNEVRELDTTGDGGTFVPDAQPPPDAGKDVDTTSCQADFQIDAKNCGSCNHDCLGGTCAGGVCQPFTIAKDVVTPDYPVVVDHVAYWTSNDGSVWSCPVVGCTAPKRLMQIDAGNPLPTGLDVHGGTAYVIGYYSASILSCAVGGCTAPTTVVSGLDNPSGVLADDAHVFFLNANTADVERCAIPSCAGGRVRIAAGPPAWFILAMDDTTVYWVQAPNADPSNATIFRAPKTQVDAGGETILSSVSPDALAVRGGVLYYAQSGSVIKVTLAPGLPQLALANGEATPKGIGVDDTDAYWVNVGDGTVRKCPLAGCNFKPTTIASGQNVPKGPYVTDDAVYWTEFNGGTVRGVAK